MEVGNLVQVRSPALVGEPIYSYNLSFFLDCIHMLGGVPNQSGLPSQPVWVTHFGGVSFHHVKAAAWGNQGNQITVPKPAKTHSRTVYHLQNCQNTDEIDSVGNNLSVELDSQAYQWNQIEVLPATIEVNFEAKSNFIITNEENKH